MPLRFRLPNISDDRGNPLLKVPTYFNLGRGPQTTVVPYEEEQFQFSNGYRLRTTDQKLKDNLNYAKVFANPDSQTDFVHNLDTVDKHGLGQPREKIAPGEIYLGSFLSTRNDNEDPTMLGWDVTIDYTNSPLFNGAIEDFINKINTDAPLDELESRLELLSKFKLQFFEFFKIDSPSSATITNIVDGEEVKIPAIPSDPKYIRTYYHKKITGLDRLMESNTSNEFGSSFVKYGTDYIGMTLNEDVSQNMGYLATLYKNLAWSRINGKQIIPENLLRFNLNLTLTEIRKYNRLIRMNDVDQGISETIPSQSSIETSTIVDKIIESGTTKLGLYADLISKYKYTLYECQMFFPKMPHGDSLDLSNPSLIEDYEIKFNYKFSTLKFERFSYGRDKYKPNYNFIDNKYLDIIDPYIDNNGSKPYTLAESVTKNNVVVSNYPKSPDSEGDILSGSDPLRDSLSQFARDMVIAGTREFNRKVDVRARLLNRTLENIRNSVPNAGRMSAPTNVYAGDQFSLRTDTINAVRGFVGRSVRGFFSGL